MTEESCESGKREATLMENDTERAEEKGSKWPQFVAAFAANIAALIAGCVIGWTSPSLPKLEQEDSPVKINKEQNSWISSLAPLAASFGPFAAGYLAEKLGKKKTLLISSAPALISWICLAEGTSIEMIYFARFAAGFTVGWIFTVLPMYCGEIAQDSVRGAVGSLMQIFNVLGILFDYIVGPKVSYFYFQIASGAFPLVFVLAFVWMPESPYYLLEVNKSNAAKKSLKWLRNKSENGIAQELKIIQTSVENAKMQSGTLKDLVATRGTTKALIISLGLVGLQQLSGINVVLFNAESIFRRAGGALSPENSAIVTGSVMLLASAFTPLAADRLGRKILLLISAVGMTASLGILGLCFHLDRLGSDASGYSFLPVAAVIVYITVYSIGFGPLPWAIMAELFPSNIKSLASTLTASFCWLLGFVVTRFFNDLVDLVGNDHTFWIFATFCIFATLFVFFLLPETKGKNFAEIQEILNS